VVQNNDIIGTMSFNIFVGIAVATIFGSGFFFDLFWPERVEAAAVQLAWKISAVVVSIMALADQIASTVSQFINYSLQILTMTKVIVARYRAHIRGLSDQQAERYFKQNGKPNPIYRHNAYCVASVVVGWPGVIASFAAAYIMWKSINHDKVYGPRSSKYTTKSEEVGVAGNNMPMTGDVGTPGVEPTVTA
jgi:hypothetical protein